MDDTLRSFYKRQKAVRKKHVRMASGYTTKMDRNGLIIQKPDNKSTGYALRLLVLLSLAFLGFKAFILAGLGEAQYLDRVAQLEMGSSFERTGAWLMQIEPVTLTLAELIAPLLS